MIAANKMNGDMTNTIDWMDGENVKPYVFVRKDNAIENPGSLYDADWFPFEPLIFDPLTVAAKDMADQILTLENKAFHSSNMPMDRWVFYDCALMPGLVVGFAQKTSTIAKEALDMLPFEANQEWTPISLFIVIPSIAPGEWVAHNLCSINSMLPTKLRYYGLGFLTKAFGLWYANIKSCCGMTQWQSPALKLHVFYGGFEILTAYTPVHSHAHTLTYRLKIEPKYWSAFFTKDEKSLEDLTLRPAGFSVNPKDEKHLWELQHRIEKGEGPFFLDSFDVRHQRHDQPFHLFKKGVSS